MGPVVRAAFEAEIEKLGGMRRLQRVYAALSRVPAAEQTTEEYAKRGKYHGLLNAFSSADDKARRRVFGNAEQGSAAAKANMVNYVNRAGIADLGSTGPEITRAAIRKAKPAFVPHTVESVERAMPKTSSARGPGIEKIAAIWGCALKSPGYYGGCNPEGADKKWSDKFNDTPFAKRALALEKAEADREIVYAQQAVEDAHAQVKEAQHRAKIATLESKLLGWKAEQGGEKEKKAMQEKLASCCPGRGDWEWADHFKSSPFYKDAMLLEAADAHMEVERTRRNIKDSARWRGNDEDRLARKELEAEHADYRVKNLGL